MITIEEQIVSEAWMSYFGEVLPVSGCPDLAAQILRDCGVDIDLLNSGAATIMKQAA
ncbi:hypothetical protein [Brevundimonas guildfordensis]|uniref:Uncharacterized protein n=1 Tax=Brevundimonas guildfordensis TaxID=2762241 RepID=A0ABR8R1B0_9CAUL|nr:hypothetical protein [Brevundimonas guildfordensis]MBD7941573.1 hypothetical protein [Brevundimonas guildfordensis]